MTQWYDDSRDETINKLYAMRDRHLERQKEYEALLREARAGLRGAFDFCGLEGFTVTANHLLAVIDKIDKVLEGK